MGVAAVVQAVSVVASVYGTVKGSSDAKKAAKSEREAQKKQQQIEDEKNRRERNSQLRQAVAARATIINNAANSGVSDSSGVQGGVGSVGTQLGSNLSFLDTVQNLQRGASADLQKAAGYRQNANTNGAYNNLFNQAANTFSGVFSSNPSAPPLGVNYSAKPWVNPDTGMVY